MYCSNDIVAERTACFHLLHLLYPCLGLCYACLGIELRLLRDANNIGSNAKLCILGTIRAICTWEVRSECNCL